MDDTLLLKGTLNNSISLLPFAIILKLSETILLHALLCSCLALYGGVKSKLLVKFDTPMCSQILTWRWR